MGQLLHSGKRKRVFEGDIVYLQIIRRDRARDKYYARDMSGREYVVNVDGGGTSRDFVQEFVFAVVESTNGSIQATIETGSEEWDLPEPEYGNRSETESGNGSQELVNAKRDSPFDEGGSLNHLL